MSYFYLASPYTPTEKMSVNEAAALMEYRYELVSRLTVDMLRRGHHVYSPIVHCHEIAKRHELPKDFPFWHNYNKAMLAPAKTLLIYRLAGYQRSKGIRAEIDYALKLNKLIKWVDLGTEVGTFCFEPASERELLEIGK